ncbi:MAG: hypothetical protein QG626_771 [Patescibacteria group bacterium]|jgi:hypothetical protein|nr:hypothetical protein [Patescibacteria group bacterium]
MRDHKLSSLGNLLGGALSRHGIGERVQAAQIVAKANDLLREAMGKQADEVQAVSFKLSELVLACKTPTARYAAEGQVRNLARRLEEAFPTQTFKKIVCRLKSGVANDDEWYNGGTV